MTRFVHAAFAASLMVATSATAVLAMGGSGPTPHTDTSHHPTAPAAGSTVGHLTKDVGEALTAAKKAADAGDMAGALAQIKVAQATTDRTPHDDFVIAQFLSAVAANLHDYPTAMGAYDTMMASPEFAAQPDPDKKLAYHDGMIVANATKQWQKVVTFGQALDAMQGNDDATYAAMAVAYYYLKDMGNAKTYANKSIDMAKAAGKQPDQAALQIQIGAQAGSGNEAEALANMENLAINYNQPDIWDKLTEIALNTKNLKEIDALYIYRLRFTIGVMAQADDFNIMTALAEQLGYPTEESKVFEQGMNSGKLSAGQVGAKGAKARKGAADDERLLPAIAAAAEKSKSGEQDVKLAEDYWGYGRYADVEAAARAGIAKGYPKDPSEGQMLLGMALVEEGKYDDAIAALASVTGSEGRVKSAHLWSVYAQAKKKQGGGAAPAAH